MLYISKTCFRKIVKEVILLNDFFDYPVKEILESRKLFTKFYTQWKKEGYSESEIAKKMFISKTTLIRYKKIFNLPPVGNQNRSLSNKNGLTRELLKEAEKIGLTHHTINRRIKMYQWTLEDAVSIPPLPRNKRRHWQDKIKVGENQ
jgi:DNA-binding transcriptional MerR regulator